MDLKLEGNTIWMTYIIGRQDLDSINQLLYLFCLTFLSLCSAIAKLNKPDIK